MGGRGRESSPGPSRSPRLLPRLTAAIRRLLLTGLLGSRAHCSSSSFPGRFALPPSIACWVNSDSDWTGGIQCSRPELLFPFLQCSGPPGAAGGGTWSGRWSHGAGGYGTEGVAENGGLSRGI